MRRVSERTEQANIVALLKRVGADVYVLGTVRRRGDHQGTMQSPGLPDLYAFVPSPRAPGLRSTVWIEVKANGGRLRPAQSRFRHLCGVSNHWHIVGGLDTVIAWLKERGAVR